MKRSPAVVVILLAIALVVSVTAVAWLAWAIRDDDERPGMDRRMMAEYSAGAPDGWDRSWRSMPGMMGMMGGAAVASESEYLAEMVAHHQEAVAAAGELARSDRPEMRSFGESIVESQSEQVALMRTWLEDWYPQQRTAVDYAPMMRELSELSGDRLDEAFLQDMIGHHMVAVMMSQHLLWRGADHDEVVDLARSIRDDQHAEIVQMQRWLAQWFDADWRGAMGHGGLGAGR